MFGFGREVEGVWIDIINVGCRQLPFCVFFDFGYIPLILAFD